MKKLLFLLFFVVSFNSLGQTFDEYYQSGFNKAEDGDYYGAIADFTKAIELDSNIYPNIFAYAGRGLAKVELKDYYGAIADFTKAIELDPNYVSAYVFRGSAKDNLGDLRGACADWKKASNLGYANAEKWVAEQCN
jgi:tetratricopeptide (TPR) repeat protein